jgi:DNA topoisomerase-1
MYRQPLINIKQKIRPGCHEAIGDSIYRSPEAIKAYLSRDQYKLYKLIWERYAASQMSPAVYDTITVEMAAGDYGLRAYSSQLKFSGYK